MLRDPYLALMPTICVHRLRFETGRDEEEEDEDEEKGKVKGTKWPKQKAAAAEEPEKGVEEGRRVGSEVLAVAAAANPMSSSSSSSSSASFCIPVQQ